MTSRKPFTSMAARKDSDASANAARKSPAAKAASCAATVPSMASATSLEHSGIPSSGRASRVDGLLDGDGLLADGGIVTAHVRRRFRAALQPASTMRHDHRRHHTPLRMRSR